MSKQKPEQATDLDDKSFFEKSPPFDGSDSEYQEWLPMLAMWLSMTRCPRSAQATAISLRIHGRARTIAAGLELRLLRADTLVSGLTVGLGSQDVPAGVEYLIRSLNESGFKQAQHMMAFSSLEDFINIQGISYPNIMAYTTAFESLYSKAKLTSGLTIDPPSLAMVMLLRSGVPKTDHSRVMSTAGPSDKLTLQQMKDALHWLFSTTNMKDLSSDRKGSEEVFTATNDDTDCSDEPELFDILEESVDPEGHQVFVSRQIYLRRGSSRGRGVGFSTGRGRGNFSRGRGVDVSQIQCFRCREFGHYQSDCSRASSIPGTSKSFLAYSRDSDFSLPHDHLTPDPSSCSAIEEFTLLSEHEVQAVYFSHPPDTQPTAICDSACTASVMGSVAYNNLRRQFPFASIPHVVSTTVFQFGKQQRSAYLRILLPVVVKAINGYIRVEVIRDQPGESVLPFLLSKSAMKCLQISIRFGDDSGSILGHPCTFDVSRHGHYVLPFVLGMHSTHDSTIISKASGIDQQLSYIAGVIFSDSQDKKHLAREISKLHVRLGHPPAIRLLNLLRSSSVIVDPALQKLVESITTRCDCRHNIRPGKPSSVSFPIAQDFNQCLTIDIMTIEGALVLKMIDVFTGYAVFHLLPNGSAATVLQTLKRHWYRYFGHPKSSFTDKGSENLAREHLEYSESLGILPLFTAAHSHESLGLCERIGGVIRSTIIRMRRDHPQLPLQALLDDATSAYNCLSNVGGFSPMQLVFGGNPPVPSVLTDHLSANSKAIQSNQPYRDRVLTLHSARQAYTLSENDECLRRALLMKQTSSGSLDFSVGDRVFYFDKDTVGHMSGWHGPVPVVGVNVASRELLLLSGKFTVSRHMSRCRLHERLSETSDGTQTTSPHQNIISNESNHTPPLVVAAASPPLTRDIEVETSGRHLTSPDDDDDDWLIEDPDPVLQPTDKQSDIADVHDDQLSDTGANMNDDVNTAIPDVELDDWRRDPSHPDAYKTHPLPEPTLTRSDRKRRVLPQRFADDYAFISLPDSSDNTNTMLTYYTDHQLAGMNKDLASDSTEFDSAKRAEVQRLLEYDTIVEIPEASIAKGTAVLGCRFICTLKPVLADNLGDCGGSVSLRKARLVVKGFQEELSAGEVTDAPTASREGTRLVVHLAAQRGWDITSNDVRAAFLQSLDRTAEERPIYVRPPKDAGVPIGTIWRLKKSLYGLRSAPAAWWARISQLLLSLGFVQCANDLAVFVLVGENGSVSGAVAVHVDDLLGTGDSNFDRIMSTVKSKVKFGTESRNNFIHTGIRFVKSKDGIHMDQQHFIQSLPPLEPRPIQPDRTCTAAEYRQFRTLLGSLMWVAATTRPDIAVGMSKLSSVAASPTVFDYNQAEKIRRYLMTTSTVGISFSRLSSPSRILAFSDSAFQNLPDAGSQGGFLVSVAEYPVLTHQTTVSSCLIAWKSAKIKRVVRSTFAAETQQCGTTFDHSARIRVLHDEVMYGPKTSGMRRPTQLFVMTDCQSLVDHLRSLKNTCTEKRLEKEVQILKAAVHTGEVTRWQHVPTELMMADGMTKSAPRLRVLIITAMRGTSIVVKTTPTNHMSHSPIISESSRQSQHGSPGSVSSR